MKKWITIFVLVSGLFTLVYVLVTKNDSSTKDISVDQKNLGPKAPESMAIATVPAEVGQEVMVTSIENPEMLAVKKALTTCELSAENLVKFGQLKINSKEMLAKNIFFTKNGEEYVLRTFAKDTYQRLVLVKLEEGEIGSVQVIPEEHKRNPSQKIIDIYLAGGEISRTDSDQRWLLVGGEELLLSFEGEQVSKIIFYDESGQVLCDQSELIPAP